MRGPQDPDKGNDTGLPSREAVLRWFLEQPGRLPGSRNALEDALRRIHDGVEGDQANASAQFLISQIVSPPRGSRREVLGDELVAAIARLAVEYVDPDRLEGFVSALAEALR